jgi:hypothetical protein
LYSPFSSGKRNFRSSIAIDAVKALSISRADMDEPAVYNEPAIELCVRTGCNTSTGRSVPSFIAPLNPLTPDCKLVLLQKQLQPFSSSKVFVFAVRLLLRSAMNAS